MSRRIKAEIEMFLGLSVIGIMLIALYFVIGARLQSQTLAPVQALAYKSCITTLNAETLAAFGLSTDDLQVSSGASYDLSISVAPTNLNISSSTAQLVVSIKNNGPDPAPFVFFCDEMPTEFTSASYQFNVAHTGNGQTPETWLISDLASGSTATVTINVTVNNMCDVTTSYTAFASPFEVNADTNTSNNVTSSNITIDGVQGVCSRTVYLPYITFEPTPTPPPRILAYLEDFNAGNPWVEFDLDYCRGEDRDGQYWVTIKNDNNRCLPPAQNNDKKPDRPYRTYGEFQVTAYHSEGPSDETDFGLFINGEGSSDYYYFVIRPNASNCTTGGNWKLVRRRNDNETTLRSGNCHPAIKRGTASAFANTMKVIHKVNRELSVYVNDQELATYAESSDQQLTGEATGIFVYSADNDVLIKFDNFTVWKFP